MRLSQFLVAKKELILQAWEEFARSLPAGRELSLSALRKDAGRMIDFIAQDLETEQSDAQELAKSLGRSPQPAKSAAQDHGLARAVEHFTLSEMVSEFRALRASVTRLWLDERPPTYENLVQLVRFNEGIDQLVAESVARFMEKLNADADLFTASISHDLRDPVSSVAMSAELLTTSRSLSAEDRAVSTRIHQSAHRITVMLQELLDFTHVRLAAAGAFEREPTDVAGMCRRLVDEAQASHRGRRFVLTASGDTTANVNRQRVGQLVANLMRNALQHGSQTDQITIRIGGTDRDVTIEVRNQGAAINPEELTRIFEPLHRGRTTEVKAQSSLGLGLYIAQTIAVAHGGSIGVTSTTSAGTTFLVRLPRSGYPT